MEKKINNSLGSYVVNKIDAVRRAVQKEKARRFLLNFITFTKPDYVVNWHHKLVCEEIDAFLADPNRTRLMLFVGPRRGKQFSYDTPVMTTKGWKAHGSLVVGDYVFNDKGLPVMVEAVGEPVESDTEIEFTTGEIFHTHGNHEWVFHKYGRKPKVFETKNLGKLFDGEIGKRGSEYIYKTPRVSPLKFDHTDLPVDPYILGYWLGNGKTDKYNPLLSFSNEFSSSVANSVKEAGYEIIREYTQEGTNTAYLRFKSEAFTKYLNETGLSEKKYFPQQLYTLSTDQRLALLSGLIDSDGMVDTTGRVGFANTNESIIEGVKYLIRSFGWWCSVHYREPKLSSSGTQGVLPVYELKFVPDIILPLRIESKRRRLEVKKQSKRVSPKRVTTGLKLGMGNCIQVEGGVYLVGKTLIPTHNSEIVSRRLPPYILGKNPNLQIIATSYGADLAQAMNRDVQRIIDSPEYQELFPATTLAGTVKGSKKKAGNYVRTSDRFEIVGYKGIYRSAGVGGGITGQGADVAIIDDVFKDWAEATSQKRRKLIQDWYSSTLYTRLSPNAKVIIINTRWHEEDLCGYLLKEASVNPNADQWEVISLPEIQDEHNEYPHPKDPRADGEVLWPTRFTETIVNKIKNSVGSKVWSALFQQRPTPAGGQIIQGEWFQYYNELPDIEYYISSWDCSFKETTTSDYVVGQVWGVCGSNKYLVYMVRERMDIIKTIKEMLKVSSLYNLRSIIIEDKANGPAIVSMLKNKVAGLIAFNPEGSKEARANAVAPQFEAGNVWLPNKYYAPNRLKHPTVIALLDDFLNEFKAFPNGANDDMVDATTQALLKIGHKVGWLEELLNMAQNKKEETPTYTTSVANVMGWNIEEPTASILDDMEDDMFNIDI